MISSRLGLRSLRIAPKGASPYGWRSVQMSSTTPQDFTVVKPISKARRRLQNFGRFSLVSLIGAAGVFYYVTNRDRNPAEQLPQDPTKKTIVVLGSGWGATSFLKGIDTKDYNVVVISKQNYFLFTRHLEGIQSRVDVSATSLPSVSVGTLEGRSIIQPTRFITRHKDREVKIYEAEVTDVDPLNKTVTFADNSAIRGEAFENKISYDYLVYGLGCENQTFGMEGVKKHACFLKELGDAEKIQRQLMDCMETAVFKDQSEAEVERLLHMVVVGGGPTGVEYAAELHDFLKDDLMKWYPEVAHKLKITLIEGLPKVLRGFSEKSVTATEQTFAKNSIDILTNTMVKDVKEKTVTVQGPDKSMRDIPYGVLVWAGGLAVRQITRDIMAKLPSTQTQRRGLTVDENLRLVGADGFFALGDATATSYFPTAQTAAQQGTYLAKMFKQMAKADAIEADLALVQVPKSDAEVSAEVKNLAASLQKAQKILPFQYSHQGSLAYIGSESAIADLPLFGQTIASSGWLTHLFWRSAYLSKLFSLRNRTMVCMDWVSVKIFGRATNRTD